jgi:hypothetical protein
MQEGCSDSGKKGEKGFRTRQSGGVRRGRLNTKMSCFEQAVNVAWAYCEIVIGESQKLTQKELKVEDAGSLLLG